MFVLLFADAMLVGGSKSRLGTSAFCVFLYT